MFSNFYRFTGGTYGSYNSANGYSQLTDVVLPDSLQTIGNRVFDGSGITKLWLPDSLTTIHNTAFSPNITLFSNRYNQAIYDYAASRSTEYIYEDKSSFPKYRLTAVVPSQGTGVRGIQTADGELHITRGTEGETAAIPEGFVVLSTEEIIFTDPVIIEEPPIAGDYAFYGWFTDPELTERWNGTTMPAADLTLYARVEPLLHVRYAINVPSYGTENEALPAGFSIYQDVLLREYQQMPSVPDPLIDGYAFIGWFMDDQFEQNYLPSSVGTSDIVVYGQLHRASVGATYELSNNTYILTGYRPEEDEDETVYIPAQHNGLPVTSIGAYAFKNGQTREIYLPDSIISVDQHAFADSAVSTINVSTGNQTFASRSGVLYSKDMTQLVCYPPKKNNQSFTVPSSVTVIAAYAFNENGILEGITFQEGLTEIGMYAFSKCTGLQEISLPDSVTTLESGAFAGCTGLKQFTAQGLTAIEGSDTETIPRNMNMSVYGPLGTGVLRDWFTYTLNGTSVAPNYNQYSVKLYVDGVLQRTISNEAGLPLSSILFDTNDSGKVVTSWYKDAEYAEAWDIENDLMPSAPLSLYASLAPVYSYEAVTLTIDGEEVTGVSLTGYNGSGTNLTLPRTIDGLPVLAIGAGFLSKASTLNSIAIGDHVLSIDDDAMNGFNGTIYCDHGSYAETWATQHGMNTEVYEYTLSFSVDNASVPVINAAKGISVRLPEPTLGSYTFAGWYTDPAHTTSVSLDEDQFFTMPGEDLTLYGYWNAAEPVDFSFEIIENNVIITGYNGTDKDIVIPASIHGLPVTRIGDGAFSNSDMISIDMGEVTSIGQGAFENCNSLLSITLPDTVSEIGTGAFANCDMLKTVHIGTGIKGVDYSWFDNCNLLHTFIVAESNPFLSSSMGTVYSKDGSTIIAYPAGKNQDSFTIPEQVSTIGAYAFYGQKHLVSIAVPASVSAIQEYAFRDCDRLTSFSASACITIGHHAFFGCSSLAGASFGDELAEIGEFAFGDCRSLSSIYIPSGAALDGNRVYFANSKLTIRGTMGSSAYQYATANNIVFFDPNAINAESIALSRTEATLVRGEKTQLEAAVSPSEATLGTLLTWHSDDDSIAYVDSEGMVYALGGGTTRVYAVTSNGLSAYCDITVEVPVSSLTMDRESLTVAIGETGQVEAIILPASATNKELSWTSSDEHVATVEGGVITAVSDGEATITATTHNGLSAELAVNVYIPVESVVINGTSSKLWVSAPLNRVRLTASVAPENATYRAIAWSTSNSGIATVDEQGVVTAIGAGTATITATTNDPSGTSATFTVTVGGDSLTPIVLPDALRTVEEEAFYNDDMIRYIQLGSQVTSIGRKSFAEMNGLLAVRIPASTTSIAGDAFENSAPVILCFDGTFAEQFAIEHSIPYILIE